MHITHTQPVRPMTQNLTRITLLVLLSLLYIETTKTKTPKLPSSSWFREKYLNEQYNQYYKYAFETDYEDRVTCPEIHKPAMINAITGATQYTMTRTRRHIILPPPPPPPPPPITVSETTPETDPPLFKSYYIYILDITIRDIVLFIADVLIMIAHCTYYTWQIILMTLMLSMTITVTILVLVMFFGQY